MIKGYPNALLFFREELKFTVSVMWVVAGKSGRVKCAMTALYRVVVMEVACCLGNMMSWDAIIYKYKL